MTVTKEEAMEMFGHDLKILIDELRGMQAHYRIGEWEAFIFLRKPDCPESYVVEYAAADDAFAKRIVQLHAVPATPSDAAMRAAEELKSLGLLWNVEAAIELGGEPFDENEQIERVAAIITRHLASTEQPARCAYCNKEFCDYCDIACCNCGTATPTLAPETPVGGEARKCVKCGHEERFSDNEAGKCEKSAWVWDDPHGGICGCVCQFAAPVVRTGADGGEQNA